MSYSILIVDDSPIIRKMMKRAIGLSSLDVGQVFEAGDGRQALEVLDREWVDVVLADIHMPHMNGTELIERMAADALLGKIPVVVVSAERSAPTIEHLRSLGISAHLVKPFTPEQVMETVTHVLTSSPARSQP